RTRNGILGGVPGASKDRAGRDREVPPSRSSPRRGRHDRRLRGLPVSTDAPVEGAARLPTDYSKETVRRKEPSAGGQNPRMALRPFGFLIPEDSLLLTRWPASRGPRNSAVRPTPLTLPSNSQIRALTNGLSAVMISCVHGANQTHNPGPPPRTISHDAR